MRYKLKSRREFLGLTREEFAKELEITERAYQAIELGDRFPREQLLKKILKKLNTDSISILDNSSRFTNGEVTKNICEYMKSKCSHNYTIYQVSNIRKSIRLELEDRKKKCITIKSRTEKGKWQIYKRIANIANEQFNDNISAYDIKLYKDCVRQEYQDRTGKCSWGIPEVRKKLGYSSKK